MPTDQPLPGMQPTGMPSPGMPSPATPSSPDARPPQPSLRVFYGGTFDPVHAGHLAMAEVAAVALGVPVRLMPAADPPHRAVPGADAGHRAAMLDLAVQGQPMLRVDRRELQREGRSYTIRTLHELRAQYGADAPLAFVVGADSLRALHTWTDWRDLLEGAHLVVAERPGSPLDDLAQEEASGPDAAAASATQGDPALREALSGRWADTPEALRQGPGGRVLRLRQPLHPASATAIRRAIAAGEADWARWLVPAVADYIRRHRLYGARPADAAALEGPLSSGPSGAPAV